MVPPAVTVLAAFWSVRNGADEVPAPVSLPLVDT
jgi:hypothetical protein